MRIDQYAVLWVNPDTQQPESVLLEAPSLRVAQAQANVRYGPKNVVFVGPQDAAQALFTSEIGSLANSDPEQPYKE